jgi:hypothetical protein
MQEVLLKLIAVFNHFQLIYTQRWNKHTYH